MINYWVHTITPLHVGSGRGLGYIDLPIAREKVTNWPYIPGSSVKGVIADYYNAGEDSRKNDVMLKAAFGLSDGDDYSDKGGSAAGALVFTDAHILCMPVRSFYGTFAWITSPFCLKRLARSWNLNAENINIKDRGALLPDGSKLCEDNKIYLEDLDLKAEVKSEASAIAEKIAKAVFADDESWQKIFTERFAVIDDDTFTFLCEAGTEVNARIRIDSETGITKDGALWYEEALPVESILTGNIWCDRVYVKDINITPQDLINKFCNKTLNLQIGGHASTGKGQARFIFAGEQHE